MYFASDNWAGAAPQIVDAIAREAGRYAGAYGTSETDGSAAALFSTVFQRDVSVFFVATGTAANSIALTAVNRPGGVVFCHSHSHIEVDECGAVGFQSGGARLMPLAGRLGKLSAADLADAIKPFSPDFVHGGQPMAVSVTQATEAGTVYTLDELGAISEVAKAHGLPLHMDGARFANALVALDVTPAEMTWKAGVDILSFGGTKNGCVAAEAIVVFDPDLAAEIPYLRMRAGHLFSKMRFVAAQFEAYLADGLWLELGRHANRVADRLRAAIDAGGHARLAWPTRANEVFVAMPGTMADRLREAGAQFHGWSHSEDFKAEEGEVLVRLVTSFASEPDHVDRFVDLLNG
ncbi:MAG TPA: low specificity L-threonine aldolase [Afifellaceae bacterium]|nr:low specificity L-threonine aldolase [Afifellaceae bacterium]